MGINSEYVRFDGNIITGCFSGRRLLDSMPVINKMMDESVILVNDLDTARYIARQQIVWQYDDTNEILRMFDKFAGTRFHYTINSDMSATWDVIVVN